MTTKNTLPIEGEVTARSVTTTPAAEAQAPTIQAGHSNPLDLPANQFSAALKRRGTNRKALIAWVRSELVEGVDFGRITVQGRLSKPSLYKPGAEKICGMLGVNAEFPTLADYERMVMNGRELDQLMIRCELRNAGGEIVASGAGARSVQSDGGDLNKALKMCLKSAMIDATLRLGGLSEVFTQDIEDMPREAFQGGHDAPRQSNPRNAPQQSGNSDVVPSGKHRGRPWSEVERDYLEWVVENLQQSALRAGAEGELERRFAREAREADEQARQREGEEYGPDNELPY